MNTRMMYAWAVAETAMAVCLAGCASRPGVDNAPLAALDLERYLGEWYEIARFDHSFERGVEKAKANYALNEDGTIKVVNSGVKDGKPKTAIGKGKRTETPALLRVSFFGPFYADYRVMKIDDGYTYALVGSGSADYLWILSRTPSLDDDAKVAILDEIHRRGYDAKKLIWVKQDEIIECPEIKSDGFSLEMPELEDCLHKVRFSDVAVVRDAVKSAIEETGRFGKERAANKRDGGLIMWVRIVEQEWHTEKKPPSPYETLYLQTKVEVTARPSVNSIVSSEYIGHGSERLYVSWGTASNMPPTSDRYADTIAGAVKKALRDLHPCTNTLKARENESLKYLGFGRD